MGRMNIDRILLVPFRALYIVISASISKILGFVLFVGQLPNCFSVYWTF